MPTLYILAGPNGSGKTSFYIAATKIGFIDSKIPFLNIDIITKDELGGYTQENFEKANLLYRQRVSVHINAGDDFMIESNLANQSDYVWIEGMKKRNYEVVLYFLCTDDIDIHKSRVKKRVLEGGHDVAEAIIEHRYMAGISYLKTKLHLFKEIFLIDNSDETEVIVTIKNGVILSPQKKRFVWIDNILEMVERLSNKGRDLPGTK